MKLRISLRSSLHFFGFIFCLIGFINSSFAQNPNAAPAATPPAEAAGPAAAPAPAVAVAPGITAPMGQPVQPPPMVKGFNFSINMTSQHSAVIGWGTTTSPALAYIINRHVILDASTPWVNYTNAYIPISPGSATTVLTAGRNLLGDTSLGGNFFSNIKGFSENVSGTMGVPTGDQAFGLSAGQVTYNFTNHNDYSIGIFTPDIEFGEGDSSSLVKKSAKKSYTAVGPLANFQAGSSISLPLNLSLDLEAYEDMPLGNQNVYGTVTKKVKGKTTTTKTLEGTGVAEDNGFTAELDVPINAHVALTGDYERSLRQGTDIVSVGISYVLRIPKKAAPEPPAPAR